MFQLTYISSARRGVGDAEVEHILASSRRNNRRIAVTGLLVFDGKRFLQVLEGHRPLVESTFETIKGDHRHFASVVLAARTVTIREFGHWDMAAERVSPATTSSSMAEIVEQMVANVPDPDTRALFTSFVKVQRSFGSDPTASKQAAA